MTLVKKLKAKKGKQSASLSLRLSYQRGEENGMEGTGSSFAYSCDPLHPIKIYSKRARRTLKLYKKN